MRRIYPLGHWGLTLLLAPFTMQAIQLVWGKNPHQVVGVLDVFPIAILFSIAFSIPTLIVYLTCFYYLAKLDVHFAISKAILIAVSVLGIYITQTRIKGSMSQDIIIAYAVTSIIVGLLLRIKNPEVNTEENPIET